MKRGSIIVLVTLLLAGCATGEWGGIQDNPRYLMPQERGEFYQPPQIGMPENFFLSICPVNYKVHTTTTAYGVHKQYVFPDGVRPKYVYFENGVLTAMQD